MVVISVVEPGERVVIEVKFGICTSMAGWNTRTQEMSHKDRTVKRSISISRLSSALTYLHTSMHACMHMLTNAQKLDQVNGY